MGEKPITEDVIPCGACGFRATDVREEFRYPAFERAAWMTRVLLAVGVLLCAMLVWQQARGAADAIERATVAAAALLFVALGLCASTLDSWARGVRAKREIRHCPRCGAFHEIL